MAFLGAAINIIKGEVESLTLPRKISKSSKQGAEFDLFEGMNAYEALEAKNNLVLAEYLLMATDISSAEKNDLWERVKSLMNDNLQAAEKELEAQQATKLDVARLIVALQQIGGETDKEITKINKKIKFYKIGFIAATVIYIISIILILIYIIR